MGEKYSGRGGGVRFRWPELGRVGRSELSW